MIQKVKLLRAIGQFDSDSSVSTLALGKFVLVYAENGRGKTTLAAILRSLSTGESLPIVERTRLGAAHAPEVVIDCSGGVNPACFRNGAWTRPCTDVLVFDGAFVDRNVYSGMDVDAEHRQNLHELILGATGVTLARRVDELAAEIRTHNANLRTKTAAIPAADRQGLNIDDFCALVAKPDVDDAIKTAEQRLAAVQNATSVRSGREFETLSMPAVDFGGLDSLLARTLPGLDASAMNAVYAHFGWFDTKTWPESDDAEQWVDTGMKIVESDNLHHRPHCPFCAQSLDESPVFQHFRAYFGQAYRELLEALAKAQNAIETALSGDALAGFERQVNSANERRRFWKPFTEVSDVPIDTVDVATQWQAARDAAIELIKAKRGDPVTPLAVSAEGAARFKAYKECAAGVTVASIALANANESIKAVKEAVKGGSAATVDAELKRLRAAKVRHAPTNAGLCADYLAEKLAKDTAEKDKATAQQALDTYRATVFPNWETALNAQLSMLGAAFTLVKIAPQPTAGRPSCVYRLLINGHEVPVGANTAPAGTSTFKTTLSGGDRNTLALAFFLAAVEHDPGRATRTLIFDDPMSSLDKHRRMSTIQVIRGLVANVSQVVVMSHDEYFLFDVYDRISRKVLNLGDTTSLAVERDAAGSTLKLWPIETVKLGLHDTRHARFTEFLNSAQGDRRRIAQDIRPHIERYLRIACPDKFQDGEMLGSFRNRVLSATHNGSPFLTNTKFAEYEAIVEYGNLFHHDTNPAADTAVIQDAELTNFVKRMLAFTTI